MKIQQRIEAQHADTAITPERRLEALRTLLTVPDTRVPVAGPLLLGMGQAAKLLGVSRSTLWRMIARKKIAPVEILPGTFRVRRVDIDRIAGVGR